MLAFDSQWVPPVGGAPSRNTSTGGAGNWGTQARPSGAPTQAAGQAAEAMSRRPAAEEMRGPPSGRAQEGRRQPLDERGQRISTPLEKSVHVLPPGDWKFQLHAKFAETTPR
jgi:hypothetical protein